MVDSQEHLPSVHRARSQLQNFMAADVVIVQATEEAIPSQLMAPRVTYETVSSDLLDSELDYQGRNEGSVRDQNFYSSAVRPMSPIHSFELEDDYDITVSPEQHQVSEESKHQG